MNKYTTISNFGKKEKNDVVNNPLTYCINNTYDRQFNHGETVVNKEGQHCENCQWFLSDYCAQGWDNFCELASKNKDIRWPNQMELQQNDDILTEIYGLTAGETLIRNTASRKYLVELINGEKIFEPFDPTVSNSPLISKWVHSTCDQNNGYYDINEGKMTPVYSVNPFIIDEDIVMDKILMNPKIAIDILLNIYKTMKRKNELIYLNNTKLGNFFLNNKYMFK